jgi:23S rRNA (uracil1939-C5)-methyltransferase
VSLRAGDRVELVVDSLAAGGDGVARLDGRVVFVPLSAPGDRVAAEIVQVERRYARAEIAEVVEPGPGRRESPCRYFGRCGGCSWLHLDAAAQRDARLRIARDALERIGGFDALPELEWLPSPLDLGYRARARVSLADGAIGFHRRGTRQVVDVEVCAVLDAMTQRALDGLRADPPADRDAVVLQGFGSEAAGLRVSPGAFFQANGALWEAWRDVVANACGRGRLAVELYAGVGYYTVALETRFDRVIAVERASSVDDLRVNTKAQVVHKSAEAFAIGELAGLEPDLLLLNPPRTGCDPAVSDGIVESRARRVVYVSCDPPTLARDLSRLRDVYRLSRVVVIDAMPQTHHVELFVVLDR